MPFRILIFLLICTLFNLGATDFGMLTTWNDDNVNTHCDPDSTNFCRNNYCSAPMVKADCTTRPGYQTAEGNKFKKLCREGEGGNRHIDGRYIDDTDRDACLRCSIPVCDTPDYPSVSFNCKTPICVKANSKQIQTVQMDVCPSNHQKNVAKCCMWGNAYCSCVNITTMDLSYKAYEALGKSIYGEWTIGQTCSNNTCKSGNKCDGSGGACGNKCDNKPPPGNSYTCEDQAKWGKCKETWMTGYCCKSCANAKKCGGGSNGGGNTCGNKCDNKPPPGNSYTCEDQAKWGKCKESWMSGYCCKSCANAKKCGGGDGSGNTCGSSCSNVPPPGNSYTCEDQAKWGKCNEPWMSGYCCKSCANAKKCGGGSNCGNSCSDIPPPNSGYSCVDQAKWRKCGESWMNGYCCKSCANSQKCGGGNTGRGTCGSSCSDNPPPSSGYSCADQAKWGKCGESWMKGYCCKSCANSYKCGGGCDNIQPPGGYTCQQQKQWGKCNESWMKGYCRKICGKC